MLMPVLSTRRCRGPADPWLSRSLLSRGFSHATTCPVFGLDKEIAASAIASWTVLPGYTIPKRGIQFVKKSSIWLTREGSDVTLAVFETLDGPLAQVALEEARALRASRGKHLDAG